MEMLNVRPLHIYSLLHFLFINHLNVLHVSEIKLNQQQTLYKVV